MKAVATILAFLLAHTAPVRGDTVPDAPRPKIEAETKSKKPSLLRSILRDRQTSMLPAAHGAAVTADMISTVHWERANRSGIEVGCPFHGGRPGVPAMTAEAVMGVGITALLAHEMPTSRFKIVRRLSFVPQSVCITTHAVAARRNYMILEVTN